MRAEPLYQFEQTVYYCGIALQIIAHPRYDQGTYKYILAGVGSPIAEEELSKTEPLKNETDKIKTHE